MKMTRRDFNKTASATCLLPLATLEVQGKTLDCLGKRRMLFENVRRALGQDIINYPQLIGDSVAMVGKNIVEYMEAIQLSVGETKEFKQVYPPYLYYASRVLIGDNKIGQSDGALPNWLNDAFLKFGALSTHQPNLYPYNAKVAKQWGNGDVPPNIKPDLKVIKAVKSVENVFDISNYLYHGYPVSIWGTQAFTMEPNKEGFHTRTKGSWNHGFTIIGFDFDNTHGHYFILLNTWGDAHGHLNDFKTGAELPVGVLRVHAEDVVNILKGSYGEAYAYSPYQDFPERNLDAA